METTHVWNGQDGRTSKPDSSSTTSEQPSSQAWHLGIHNFPWLPALALVAIFVQCVAVVIILQQSNGKDITSWDVQPSVLISLLSSGLGIMVTFIYTEDTRIDWWLFLLRGGTLDQIHERFEVAGSIVEASLLPFKRRTFNRITLGCLGAAIMFPSGTFFQKASTVKSATRFRDVNTHLQIAPELPARFSSQYTGRVTTSDLLQPTFAQVLQDFNGRYPIPTNATCDGSCAATFPGAGFAINCTDGTFGWDFVFNDRVPIFGTPFLAFQVVFSFTWSGGEVDCVAVSPTQSFPFQPNPSVPIDFKVKNKNFDSKGDMFTDRHIALLNSSDEISYLGGSGTTYIGYVTTVNSLYGTQINVTNAGAAGWEFDRSGAFGAFYLDYLPDVTNLEAITFRDPTNDVVRGMRELMFRMAIAAAQHPTSGAWIGSNVRPGANKTTGGVYNSSAPTFNITATAHETRSLTVYGTDYLYLGLGLAWVMLVVALIAPIFWGFWHLGRTVSLSPLEIAQAFDSPLFAGVGTNIRLEGLRKAVGSRKVWYGEVLVAQSHSASDMTGTGRSPAYDIGGEGIQLMDKQSRAVEERQRRIRRPRTHDWLSGMRQVSRPQGWMGCTPSLMALCMPECMWMRTTPTRLFAGGTYEFRNEMID